MKLDQVPNKIVTCYAGSVAYGTNTPESDIDIRGVFCAEEKYIRTPFYNIKEVDLEDCEDGKMYELTNFMKLYCDMNPDILETLWVDEEDIITSSTYYEFLRSKRSQLLSSKCAHTFSGYAMSQLKRIKGHNKWINNPQPVDPPRHGEFLKLIQNFTTQKVFSRDFSHNYKTFLQGRRIVHYGGGIFGVVYEGGVSPLSDDGDFNISAKQCEGVSSKEQPLYIIKYCADEYKRDKYNHTNYWNWKNNRNPVRAALEEKHGADLKHVSHTVRLLRMAKEILEEGVVKVKRPDAQELLDIRNGAWSYDTTIKWASDTEEEVKRLLKNTHLRKTVDIKVASDILIHIQDNIWRS